MTENISKTANARSERLSAANNRLVAKIASCLIPFVPLAVYYFVPFTTVSLDTALVVLVAAYVVLASITNNEKVKSENCRFYFLLVLWTLSITTLYYLLNRYAVNYGIGLWFILLVFFVILGVEKRVLDAKTIVKAYRVLACCAIVLLGLQWAILYLTGYRVSFMLLFLPFNDAYSFLDVSFLTAENAATRFAAFFSERSHFCLFLTPLLCMSIYDFLHKKGRIWLPIITTLAMLSTTSGNGIIVSGIAWIVAAMFMIKGNKKYFYLIFVGILIIGVYLFLRRIPEFNDIFSKLFTSENRQTHSKADYRIYRGFDYYSQLPLFNKFFGIGYRCLESSFSYYNLVDHYRTSGEYMGCIGQILVYSGALGIAFFLLFFGRLFMRSNDLCRTILICFLAYCFSSSIYFDAIWILYFALVFSINRLLTKETNDLRSETTNETV